MQSITHPIDLTDYRKRTKIVCSLGPACSSTSVLENLLKVGVNVFRLNFSFGSHDDMRGLIKNIREASKNTSIPVSILGDLQGPKFRTGDFEGGSIPLQKGSSIKMKYATKDVLGTRELIICPHQNIVRDLKVGDKVLLYDGTMELKVSSRISEDEIVCIVERGGTLYGRKGINVPQMIIKLDDMLDKDKKDAQFLLDVGVDFIGLSFVQSAKDVAILRKFLESNAKDSNHIPHIISKIEKPQALDDIDAIMKETDGIMVARGDLGVELSLEMVPIAQKMLIKKANRAGKPVITATQMLSSMERDEHPTRAEVSDIANSIVDGTDAVMTSGETAMSIHPVLTIQTMAKIIMTTEQYLSPPEPEPIYQVSPDDPYQLRRAIAHATIEAAKISRAKAILVFSESGEMAKVISTSRPKCIIIALLPSSKPTTPYLINHLRLFNGIYPLSLDYAQYMDPTIAKAESVIFESGLLKKDDPVVLCGGSSLPLKGLSNITKIYKVGEFLGGYASKFTSSKSQPAK